ncbi:MULTISPECIES: Gfo/Idh/MocA family protein [Chelativorans]|jgi:predicted dehydrogenase|uniref:Oxidoreductase-like protein n=1 Tax=Chelativorans sp. (strain BNC1) TaxID=266779 RepID=Q11AN2_CHESB|nr:MULTISPECIES: Gfo/Idh/MocA family oxidoreductase [Chelativorans]
MSKVLAWGVLSTANIGITKVIPAMQKSSLLQVAAIASRRLQAAREAADRLGIDKAYGSYEELLADPDIDIIYNPLPNHLHVPWTIKAMEAGKHVLCEKPIALNEADARQLVKVRDRTGKQVVEAFMVRHHPQWLRSREIARSCALGDVRVMNAFFSYFLTDPANVRNQADIGGGGLYDVGCYAIASGRYIFEREPERVIGFIERDPQLGTDRLTSGIVDFGGGARLLFTCSTQLARYQQVDVCGTRGRLRMELPFNPDSASPAEILIVDEAGQRVERMPAVDHYQLQAEAFGHAVETGGPVEFPIEDAVANMRVIDAIFRSTVSQSWEVL